IITRLKDRPENGVVITVACVHRITTGSGKSRSTNEEMLWSSELTVAGASTMQTMEGLRVPFSIGIQGDARECDISDSNNEIVWRLNAKADLPGIDYAAQFDIPVFRTAETPHEVRRFQPNEMEVASWTPAAQSAI